MDGLGLHRSFRAWRVAVAVGVPIHQVHCLGSTCFHLADGMWREAALFRSARTGAATSASTWGTAGTGLLRDPEAHGSTLRDPPRSRPLFAFEGFEAIFVGGLRCEFLGGTIHMGLSIGLPFTELFSPLSLLSDSYHSIDILKGWFGGQGRAGCSHDMFDEKNPRSKRLRLWRTVGMRFARRWPGGVALQNLWRNTETALPPVRRIARWIPRRWMSIVRIWPRPGATLVIRARCCRMIRWQQIRGTKRSTAAHSSPDKESDLSQICHKYKRGTQRDLNGKSHTQKEDARHC